MKWPGGMLVGVLLLLAPAWTVRVEHKVVARNTATGGNPPHYETNYLACISLAEPNTNRWIIEYTRPTNSDSALVANDPDLRALYWTWSAGGYVTGNQAACFFTAENPGGPDWSFPAAQFYRARLLQ